MPIECECRLLFLKNKIVGLKLTPISEGGFLFCETFAPNMIINGGKVGFLNNSIDTITFKNPSQGIARFTVPELYLRKIKYWFADTLDGYVCAPKPEQSSFLLTTEQNQQYDEEIILSVP